MADAKSDLKKSDLKPDTLDRFRTLHARLAITMAHELVHIYILFLCRSRSQHTPSTMTYGPFGDSRVGESGRFWEGIVFGGYIDMRRATGEIPTEAIAIRDQAKRYAWRLTPDAVYGILRRDFGVWLQPGMELNNQEHCKYGTATVKMGSLAWRINYEDIFPEPSAQELREPQELPQEQLTWLTGNIALLRAGLRLTLQWGELGEPGEPGVSATSQAESGKLESVCLQCEASAAPRSAA